jgi:hypothetical protein
VFGVVILPDGLCRACTVPSTPSIYQTNLDHVSASLFDLKARPIKSSQSSDSSLAQPNSSHNSSNSQLDMARRHPSLPHSSGSSGGSPVDFTLFPSDSQLELQLLELSYADTARKRVRRVNSMRRATSATNSRCSSPQPSLGRGSRGSSMAKLRRSTSLRLRQRAATVDTSSLEALAGRPRLGTRRPATSATALLDGLRDTVV